VQKEFKVEEFNGLAALQGRGAPVRLAAAATESAVGQM